MSYCSRGFLTSGPFGADHKWHGVHAEAGDAELDPEAHDLKDLGLHFRIVGVEVGLEVVKAVEIPLLRDRIVSPCCLLDAGKDHALVGIGRLLLRPHVPVAIFRVGIASRLLKPGMFVRRVIDHEVDQHTDAALLGGMRELDEIAERAVGRD